MGIVARLWDDRMLYFYCVCAELGADRVSDAGDIFLRLQSMRRLFASPPSCRVCCCLRVFSRDRCQHARCWTGDQSEWRHTNHKFIHVCQKKTEKHHSHLESPTA